MSEIPHTKVSKDNYLGEVNYNKLFPVRKELLQLYSLQPRHLGALVMPDTSMEPSISKDDMQLVDTSVKEIERDAKHIYALVKNKTTLLILRVKGDALGEIAMGRFSRRKQCNHHYRERMGRV